MAQKVRYYRGLPQIAARLNVSAGAVRHLQRDFALPIYRDFTDTIGPGWAWTIDEPSIRAWSLWRARVDRAYDSLRSAIGDPALSGTSAAHAKQHYLKTMQRYRQLLLEQHTGDHSGNGRVCEPQVSSTLTSDIDLDLTLFNHVEPDGETSD